LGKKKKIKKKIKEIKFVEIMKNYNEEKIKKKSLLKKK
jgi:hypothetical protein